MIKFHQSLDLKRGVRRLYITLSLVWMFFVSYKYGGDDIRYYHDHYENGYSRSREKSDTDYDACIDKKNHPGRCDIEGNPYGKISCELLDCGVRMSELEPQSDGIFYLIGCFLHFLLLPFLFFLSYSAIIFFANEFKRKM